VLVVFLILGQDNVFCFYASIKVVDSSGTNITNLVVVLKLHQVNSTTNDMEFNP